MRTKLKGGRGFERFHGPFVRGDGGRDPYLIIKGRGVG